VSSPESFLPLKNDVLHICLAIALRPLHGYAIMRDVEQRSSGTVVLQAGAFYRTLRSLLNDNLIVECPAPADEVVEDVRRRYYRLTPLGARVLDAEVARLAQLVRTARSITAGKRPRLA
jgi:DNA-binding PadR family transcriptional regulator